MKPITIGQTITNRQDESLEIYLKEVSKCPLITAEEEVELSKKIQEGDKKALNKLILANLRFAISVAKQYQNKGLSLVDLIQAGNLGLIEAAQTFDGSRGFKFISYAVWWIRQSIIKAISEQSRTVRVPMSQIAYSSKVNRITEKFEQEYGRKPSFDELEENTNYTYDRISSSSPVIKKSVSLDSPFNDEDAGSLIDVLANNNSPTADSDLLNLGVSTKLNEILDRLSYRDRDVIRMSFGIGMDPMQNEEIANRFGIGCERVRQIKERTLEYLRNTYKEELQKLL